LPTIAKERDSLRLRINAQSLREFRAPRRWPLDRPSPFEATRVLDPAPNAQLNREARDDAAQWAVANGRDRNASI
jgi:hypothetical protein